MPPMAGSAGCSCAAVRSRQRGPDRAGASSWTSPSERTEIVDARALAGAEPHLTPGLVDIHNHGGAGSAHAEGAVAIAAVAAFHAAAGTTRIVASLVSAGLDELALQLDGVRAAQRSTPGLLGAHLEGPFLQPARGGAHDRSALGRRRCCRRATARARRGRAGDARSRLAGGLDAVSQVVELRAVAAVGHSDADLDAARAAFDAGATLVTHAFNAMPPLHHRAPGLLGAAIDDPRVTLEAIPDGVHLHPAVLSLLFRAAPGRVALITDAIAAAGQGDGATALGGLPVEVRDGVATLGDGTIAGSSHHALGGRPARRHRGRAVPRRGHRSHRDTGEGARPGADRYARAGLRTGISSCGMRRSACAQCGRTGGGSGIRRRLPSPLPWCQDDGMQPHAEPKYQRLVDQLRSSPRASPRAPPCRASGAGRRGGRLAHDGAQRAQRARAGGPARPGGRSRHVRLPTRGQPPAAADELQRRHARPRALAGLAQLLRLVVDLDAAAALGVVARSRIVRLDHLRLADGRPFAIERARLVAAAYRHARRLRPGVGSLYRALDGSYGIRFDAGGRDPRRARTPRRRRGPRLGPGEAVSSRAQLQRAGRVVEHTVSTYPADRFELRARSCRSRPRPARCALRAVDRVR